MRKFDGVHIFTSGLNNRFFGAGIAIVEEISGHVILVHLLFKSKVSVLIIGLYTCASFGDQFKQIPGINFFIGQVVNSSNFIVLGSNFNKNKSMKSASFEFCLGLGLINSFGGHFLARASIWSNSKGIEKVIDHIFVSKCLILAVAGHRVKSVSEFFDTNYKAVLVSVGLSGLLDVYLDNICRHANKDCWKFKLKNVDADGLGTFYGVFFKQVFEEISCVL
ncbi:hypothetical protein G9A89_018829 [Geosiphon pyriformis]|nr:hypothetical protein G9A89_018829 [Geosiphon pyriformis]